MANTQRIRLNGVVDTKEAVLANINNICNNSACFLTWDPTLAKWRVIINDAVNTASVRSFDDTNIVGAINQTGVPFSRMYNVVNATFPHTDLRGTADTVRFELTGERYANELDNELNVTYSLTNDPTQAQYLANIEVKQSRLDKIIRFSTDYQGVGLFAGEVISVSNPIYGYVGKLFRIITVEESDGEAGEILFNVTALEYDPGIYSVSLTRDERNKVTDITPFELNTCVQTKIAEDLAETLSSTGPTLEEGIYGDYYNIPQITVDQNKQITKIQNILRPGYTLLEAPSLGELNVTADTNTYNETGGQFYATTIFIPGTPIPAGSAIAFEPTDPQYRYDTGVKLIVPYTGIYYLKYEIGYRIFFQRGADDNYIIPDKIKLKTQMDYIKNGTRISNLSGMTYVGGTPVAGNSAEGSWFFDVLNLVAGDEIEFVVRFKTDYGPFHPQAHPDTEISWISSADIYYIDAQYDYINMVG